MLAVAGVVGIEVSVANLVRDEHKRRWEIARVRHEADETLARRLTPVIYTSRRLERPEGMEQLTVARSVSDALVQIARELVERPDFIIGKGGITSSDIGVRGLGVKRAVVLGQVRPGVPVWRLGPETRFAGAPYVVFPGNVGAAEALAEIVSCLRGDLI